MRTSFTRTSVTIAFAGALLACQAPAPQSNDTAPAETTAQVSVEHGGYLVNTAGGCHDCHTPKIMTPNGPVLDSTRVLSGYPADRPVPPVPSGAITADGWAALSNADGTGWAGPWGLSFSANITPDSSGIGGWTEEMFVQAMRTGRHAGSGRPILPPMPWQNYGQMTDVDLRSMFAYLKSVPPVRNMVPAPVPPPQ